MNGAEIARVLREDLTAAQVGAAEDNGRDILCLACAGSGKSRTLAFRIARLIAHQVDPASIVAFTFTDKAADTIKRRVTAALSAAGIEPTLVGLMYIGTIHSFCQKVLSEIDARYRQFDVLDGNRLILFLVSRYAELGVHRVRQQRQARYFETVQQVASAWTTVNDELLDIAAINAQDAVLGQVLQTLSEKLDEYEFIDFSLMIRRAVELLRDGRAHPGETVRRLRHLLVDEYQDVNPAQEALIRELHGRGSTLFVVGDDDQAIYSWRGADVQNILTFRARYGQASMHALSHNFRSTRAIVAGADGFAAAELGATRIVKNPSANDPAGPRDFRNLWFPTRADEAAWVIERIRALLGTAYLEQDGSVRGLTPADFAILMRSTRTNDPNGLPRHTPFTQALDAAGVKYSLEAGGGAFDRLQVRVLRQTFGLLRAGSPSRDAAQAHFDAVVLPAFPDADFLQFTRVLAEWGRQIHGPIQGARRRVYPQQLVYDFLNAFRVERSAFDDEVMRDLGLFSRMIQDVEAVYLSIDSPGRFGELLNFLENVAESGYDTSTDDLVMRPDVVTVATVHKMKGLEFPVVFVSDVEDGRFPGSRRAYSGWLPNNVLQQALARGAYQSTADSEARLFYTALTRAERYLYVTGATDLPGGRKHWAQSRFSLRLNHPELSADPHGLPAGLVAAQRRRRVEEADLPTSFSEIRYYLLCPKNYQFRKSYGFSPPIPEMFGFGKTVHTAVEKLHEVFTVRAPTSQEAEALARDLFHLKHVAPSRDPENNPGPYERAAQRAAEIVGTYAATFAQDFARERQVETRFEVAVRGAVISGSIDLLLRQDAAGNILDASVIDFKAIEAGPDPEANPALDWTELALQVQLYAKAAREVLGENARTGHVHLLKDNQRVEVPVGDAAVEAAVDNVEWAVERILAGDFPMRPQPAKCEECDFKSVCAKRAQPFQTDRVPPTIQIPGNPAGRLARAFSEFEP